MKKVAILFAVLLSSISLSFAQTAVSTLYGDVDPEGNTECVSLSYNLRLGSRDASTNGEVSMLQDYLGISPPTGYFGRATLAKVKEFQASNGLLNSGYVGPLTRTKIKEMSCSGQEVSTAPTNPGTIVINPPVPTSVFRIERDTVNPLTVQAEYSLPSPCSSFTLDWGDGTNSNFKTSSNLYCAQVIETYTKTHTYSQPGTYTVKFQTGNSPQVSLPITVGGTKYPDGYFELMKNENFGDQKIASGKNIKIGSFKAVSRSITGFSYGRLSVTIGAWGVTPGSLPTLKNLYVKDATRGITVGSTIASPTFSSPNVFNGMISIDSFGTTVYDVYADIEAPSNDTALNTSLLLEEKSAKGQVVTVLRSSSCPTPGTVPVCPGTSTQVPYNNQTCSWDWNFCQTLPINQQSRAVTVSMKTGGPGTFGVQTKIAEFTVKADATKKIALESFALVLTNDGVPVIGFAPGAEAFRQQKVEVNGSTVSGVQFNESYVPGGLQGLVISFNSPYEVSAGQTITFAVYAVPSYVSNIPPASVRTTFLSPATFKWRDITSGNVSLDGTAIKDFPTSPYTITFSTPVSTQTKIITPNGGENLAFGTPYAITWNPFQTDTSKVNVFIVGEKPSPYGTPSECILGSSEALSGKYSWTPQKNLSYCNNLPSGLVDGGRYKILLRKFNTSGTDPVIIDQSDNYFTLGNVSVLAPTITSFVASPSSIQSGQSTVISWSTKDATSCTLNGAPQSQVANGVSVGQGGNYTLACSGPGGTVSKSLMVSVYVVDPVICADGRAPVNGTCQPTPVLTPTKPTILSFISSPTSLQSGQTGILSWSVKDATNCTLNGAPQSQIINGVSPITKGGVYKLSCSNAGGTVSQELTVLTYVVDPVICADGSVAVNGACPIPKPTLAPTYSPQVTALYKIFLDRAPDAVGAPYFQQKLDSGTTVTDAAWEMLASPEGQGKWGNVTTISHDAYINLLYQRILGYTPTATILESWVTTLKNGTSRKDVLYQFINYPESFTRNYDLFRKSSSNSFQVLASSVRALEQNYVSATAGTVALSALTTLTQIEEVANFTGLKRGANEVRVSRLKEILRTISPSVSLGCANLSITNTLYGPTTEECVKVFQTLNELEPTGSVNEQTNKALNRVLAR